VPQRAEVPGKPGSAKPATAALGAGPTSPLVPSAVAVLAGPVASRSYQGPLVAGTVLASVAPSGRWQLVGRSGAAAPRSPAFGWAASYAVPARTVGTLRFDGGILPLLIGVYSLLAWAFALAALVDRRRIRREWERVGRPRSWSTGRSRGADPFEDVWALEDGELG
jgi:hypothetical protein